MVRNVYFLFVHTITTLHTCPALWSLRNFLCSQHLPTWNAVLFSQLYSNTTSSSKSSQIPLSRAGSLPSLPRAPQTPLFVPLLLHFYSLSPREVNYVCACLLWASKGLIEVKTIALASDSPDFISDELVWPWAFCVTSWSPVIFRDKTGILIYFPPGFLVGFMYLFVFKKCIIMHLPHDRQALF